MRADSQGSNVARAVVQTSLIWSMRGYVREAADYQASLHVGEAVMVMLSAPHFADPLPALLAPTGRTPATSAACCQLLRSQCVSTYRNAASPLCYLVT